MIGWGHTAVGTGVGLVGYGVFNGTEPLTGLIATGVAGVTSHYITDFIPHGHYFDFEESKRRTRFILFFDIFLSIAFFTAAVFLSSFDLIKVLFIWFGIVGSQIPDMIDGLIFRGFVPLKGILKTQYNFHHHIIHWHGALEKGLPVGIYDLWQVATVVVVFYLCLTT